MSEDEARQTLERFAADDQSIGHVCEPEGVALLRRAAHSYATAMEAKGDAWPSTARIQRQTAPSMRNIESYAVMMLAFGFLSPSHLSGDAEKIAMRLRTEARWDFSFADISRHEHCRELYGIMRESMSALVEVAGIERQIERATERRDHRRLRGLMERRGRIVARIRARQEEVGRQIGGYPRQDSLTR